jgi:light-regulated signal transduction histidine kinase (bacteriophytochrome)
MSPEDVGAVADLDTCAQEPIHIPGAIQPQGALLVLDPADFHVRQASANASAVLETAISADDGTRLADLDGGDALAGELRAWMGDPSQAYLRTLHLCGERRQILVHQTSQGVILEVEAPPESGAVTLEVLYPRLRQFMEDVGSEKDLAALCAAVARQVRGLTGYDRALVYRFDESWNGAVLAEDRNDVLPYYLDLRFPASDIPAQARELYRLNRVRLIADAGYTPSPVLPAAAADGRPLDLSFAALRSVSPVHLEYMRNMGTWASMSVSIVVEGRLWGLISCHNAKPRLVSAHIRAACDFLGSLLGLQVAAHTRLSEADERLALKRYETELVARLAVESSYEYGLQHNAESWLRLTGAAGAAVVTQDALLRVGQAPPIEAVRDLADLLRQTWPDQEVYVSSRLSESLPEAPKAVTETAAGLLAVQISQMHSSYVLWFRPEIVRTVTWAGDPRKPAEPDARIHPRKSFASWTEQVRGCAEPWTPAQVQSAREFRSALLNFVLQRAEERAELTGELTRANKELEAFSYSVSHDLRAPFRHIVGYAELLQGRATDLDPTNRRYLDTIIDAAISAGRLVDDLLAFSQTGRASVHPTRVDMDKLLQEVLRVLPPEAEHRAIKWNIGTLPPAWGDPSMLRQAWTNLIGNAVKYTRGRDPAVITVKAEDLGDCIAYTIEDNGVGFDMAYVGKLFGVFQRLHGVEEFEGTGIGLALVRRIIERHGGEIEAFGNLGAGARFRFTLPSRPRKDPLV